MVSLLNHIKKICKEKIMLTKSSLIVHIKFNIVFVKNSFLSPKIYNL